jgi:hypothetical protein
MTSTHCCVTSKVLWQIEVYMAASDSAVHTRIRGFCVSCYECDISSFESVGKESTALINSLPLLRNDLHKCKGCTAIPHQICCAHLSCLDIYLYSDFGSESCFCLQESQANCLDPWCYSMMMYLLLQLLHKVAKIYQTRTEADVTAMVGHMSCMVKQIRWDSSSTPQMTIKHFCKSTHHLRICYDGLTCCFFISLQKNFLH